MKRTARRAYATVAAGVTFAAALLIGLMFYGGYWTLPGLTGSAYTVSAFVPNAANVAVGAHLMIAGLDVGRVTGVRTDGPNAVLGLRLDGGPTPLAQNSRVAVRLRSLLGETYVEVYPGNSTRKVPSGGSLGLGNTVPFVDVDQILQALSGSTEGATRTMVQSADAALAGRSAQLNATLGSGANLLSDLRPLTSTLAAQHAHVSDLVANLGTMMNAIGQRTTAIEQFARGGADDIRGDRSA
jgi:virulence factor Mce-like protein